MRKFSLLIVDDEINVSENLKNVLQKLGFEVEITQDPKNAIEIIKNKKYHILITDFFMPGMAGDELAREIRAINKEIYIILQTAHAEEKPELEMLQALDINSYYDKSEPIEKLIILLEQAKKICLQMEEIRSLTIDLELAKKCAEVDKLKDEFLANTSHELKTPLNGIIGITQSLIDGAAGQLSDAVLDDLKTVVNCGKRLSNLVNDILDYQKLKNNEITIKQKNVPLRDLVTVVMTILRPLAMSEEQNKFLGLTNLVDDTLAVFGDENRIEQILYNLIGNAIKFTKTGIVAVNAKAEDEFVKIWVRDTGIGIPEEKIKDLFKSFEQLDASISREYGGTGLGLSITKQLVELHGGKIWVESKTEGKEPGTVFYFTLPRGQEIEAKEEGKTVYIGEHDFSKYFKEDEKKEHTEASYIAKILVADDEEANRKVLKNLLSMNQYSVEMACDGEQALELIYENQYDLILLDVMMPKKSGYEVCRSIRIKHTLFDLPILMLTAKTQVESMIAGFDAGANDYVSKPFNNEELLSRIKNLLLLKQIHQDIEAIIEKLNTSIEKGGDTKLLLETDIGLVAKLIETYNQLQEALKSNQNMLVERERLAMLGELAGGMAHEINNPLAAIMDSFFVIRNYLMPKDNQQIDELSDNIEECCRRIGKISSSVLAQVRNLNNANNDIEFKLSDMIDEIKIMLSHKNKILGCSININGEEGTTLYTDKGKLSQIFINLIGNAIDAYEDKKDVISMEDRVININVKLDAQDVTISVSDKAGGIPERMRDGIFKKILSTKITKGTGLGLKICYSLITGHFGGKIRFEAETDKGTTFYISLPVKNVMKQETN